MVLDRPKFSRTHAIAETTDFIRGEIDEKSNGIACCIDLQKTFDSLDQKIPLAKLSNYGFIGPIHKIKVEYFSCRSQCVNVNGSRSDIARIITVVLKGQFSVLFLFVVYIKDFPQNFQNDNKIALFATDIHFKKWERKL